MEHIYKRDVINGEWYIVDGFLCKVLDKNTDQNYNIVYPYHWWILERAVQPILDAITMFNLLEKDISEINKSREKLQQVYNYTDHDKMVEDLLEWGLKNLFP